MIRILFSMLMSFRWWVVAAVVLGWLTSVARADQEFDIRAALDANFSAYNNEDVPTMMETLSPTLPDRDAFADHAQRVFETNDVYIRVEDFELLEVRGNMAKARVVQVTLPAKDVVEETDDEDFFRNNSGLLPDAERVEYVQGFKKEGGKWRLWLIMSQPRKPFVGYDDTGKYHGPNAAEINRKNGKIAKSDCPNGNCGFPRVKVTSR